MSHSQYQDDIQAAGTIQLTDTEKAI